MAAINGFACSSGADFDATVFYDSEGVVRVDRSHHFCGYEGLLGELERVEAASLADFYRGLPQCRLTASPWGGSVR